MLAKILIDNIGNDGLIGEWGLSVYVEYEGKKYLLDAGTTGKFTQNARAMGIRLQDVDYSILSHAHYDHADGFKAFFKENEKAPLLLREGTAENCYHYYPIFKKYIGIHRGYLKKYANRIRYVSGDFSPERGVYLIPHKTPGLEEIGKAACMCVKKNHKWVFDDFSHEQSLVFDTAEGLVIFNSCSHGGADNIITEIGKTFPDRKIYALIGGFHLFRSSDEEVRALAGRIKETGIQRIYTGHCTGKRAFSVLKEELGDIAEQLHVGLEIKIG